MPGASNCRSLCDFCVFFDLEPSLRRISERRLGVANVRDVLSLAVALVVASDEGGV